MTNEEGADFINRCHDKEDNSAEPLDEFEKAVTLVSSVDFEIALGGLAGFYYNSAGDKVDEMVDALKAIGANDAAEAVSQSIRLFPDAAKVSQRDYRHDYVQNLASDFRVLETKYVQQKPCVWDLLMVYVRNHFGL